MYTELKIQRAALANEGRILKTEGMSALKRGRTILGIDRRPKKHEPDEEHPLKDKPFKHRTLKIATGQIDETGKAVLREAMEEEVKEAAEHAYSQYQGYYDQRMIIRKESRIAHLVHTLLTERPYRDVEVIAFEEPDWKAIRRMAFHHIPKTKPNKRAVDKWIRNGKQHHAKTITAYYRRKEEEAKTRETVAANGGM